MVKGWAHPAPGRQEVLILTNSHEDRTYLVYYINEGLCVIPKEMTDQIAHFLARRDCLNQGGEIIWSGLASDQPSTGWSVEVGMEEGRINKIGEDGTKAILSASSTL